MQLIESTFSTGFFPLFCSLQLYHTKQHFSIVVVVVFVVDVLVVVFFLLAAAAVLSWWLKDKKRFRREHTIPVNV